MLKLVLVEVVKSWTENSSTVL